MTSSQQVHQETVELIADAVSELTRRAIRPELQPFGQELSQLTAKLKSQVDHVAEPISGLTVLLNRLGARMDAMERTVVVELRRAHAEQRSGTDAAVTELRAQLDATRRVLRTTRVSLFLLIVVLAAVVGDLVLRS